MRRSKPLPREQNEIKISSKFCVIGLASSAALVVRSRQVFEVDQALVLRAKRALLSEEASSGNRLPAEARSGVGRAHVVAVEVDLSVNGWEGELFEAGFDPSMPSAWILEGLTMCDKGQKCIRFSMCECPP